MQRLPLPPGKKMVAPLIAVVDNDDAIAELMRDVLTGEGYRVVTALAADEAAAMIARERPSLVILDLYMEHTVSGMTVLDALPIIVCSADLIFLREHADDLRAMGCEILEKPFDLDDLLTRVARLTESGDSP